MKIWLSLPFLPLDVMLDLAGELERVGVEGVTVSDHVCVPARIHSTYPYTGKQATLPAETDFPDPVALLSALSARTTTLRLMTHVLLASLRHPVVLAKELATVSALSGGRLDVGIGVGWLREEFEAVGVSFEQRGAITDEVIDVMRLLWTGEIVEFDGDHFSFGPLASHPTPRGPVALLGGGYSAPALRRAARLGGWLGVTPTYGELEALLVKVQDACRQVGRESAGFLIRTGIKGTLTPALITSVGRLGVDALIVTPHQLATETASPDELVSRCVVELAHLVDAAASID